jgi:hypothetical protein
MDECRIRREENLTWHVGGRLGGFVGAKYGDMADRSVVWYNARVCVWVFSLWFMLVPASTYV